MTRGREPGGQRDPLAMLDAEMNATFEEISSRGQGVDVEDVVRPREPQTARPRREPQQPSRRETRSSDTGRDERGRFLSRNTEDEAGDGEIDAYAALDAEPPDEVTDRRQRRTERDDRRSRRTQRASETATDDDFLDEDDDDRDDARRRPDADEAELDDDELELEGDEGLEDEGYDEDERPRAARDREDDEGDRRAPRQKRPSRKMQAWIDRQVEQKVGKVLEQNEALRVEKAKRDQAAANGVQFLLNAIGTPEQLERLEGIALDTRRPQAERDRAAKALAGYRENKKFALQYREGLLADIQAQQAQDDQAVVKAMAELRALDPKVVAKGNRAETLVHAYAVGRSLGQQEAQRTIAKLKRQLANARGLDDERRVTRRMGDPRAGVARASERRANGRVARPDPLRGALHRERGIGSGSTVTVPTDQMLDSIKNGEATLADYGLGRLAI